MRFRQRMSIVGCVAIAGPLYAVAVVVSPPAAPQAERAPLDATHARTVRVHIVAPPETVRLTSSGRFGNVMQFLTNTLIFAEANGNTDVVIDDPVALATLRQVFPVFPNSIQIDRAVRAEGEEALTCASGALDACHVPLQLRHDVMQHYLAPLIDESCAELAHDDFDGLTIYMRKNFRPAEARLPKYLQPPCALYERVIEGSETTESNATAIRRKGGFREVRLLAGDRGTLGSPCEARIKAACKRAGCRVRVFDAGSLREDACRIAKAKSLVLATSTLSWSLLLTGPKKRDVFGMLPCEGCVVDSFHYYGLAAAQNKGSASLAPSQYHRQMCEVFGDGMHGYDVDPRYLEPLGSDGDVKSLLRQRLSSSPADIGFRSAPCPASRGSS